VNTEPQGVARLSFLRGDVSVQRGDSGDTSAAELNTPLVAGDRVFTGPGARVEIQLDWANMLRLDESADASIADLDSGRIQVQLGQGLAFFSMLAGADADVEIDTPNVAVHPRRDGRYRVEVLPSADTLVTVHEGEADISTSEGSTLLRENQLVTVRGVGTDVQYQIARAPFTDEFDRWNSDRDRIISNAESYRRTNRYYTGASDLDAYGRWDRIPDYGYVWVPRVTAGWAPYRQGRWVWTAYWGWTWTSYEPWGWAPYHYGRWFVHRGSWVWWPGPVTPVYRPVYAPAYVSFFGFGSNSGFSVGIGFGGGFGSIGWLPVGPCDYVHPWWGRNRNTFNVVNVTNITNVYNVRNVNVIAPLRRGNRDSNVRNMLVSNQVRHAVSTVDADRFGRGRADVRTVSATELRQGRFMTGNVPVVPSRESLRTSDRTVVAAPTRSQGQERFFTRRTPSTQRESFSDESVRVEQAMNGGGFGRSNGDTRNHASNSGPDRARGVAANNAPVDNSVTQPQQSTGQTRTPSNNNGAWRSFGGRQAASIDRQINPSQRQPVLRAPRQRSSVAEAAPNRPEPQAASPRPAPRENPSTQARPGFQRFSDRTSENRQFVAQNNSNQQRSGNQAESGDDRSSGWQTFRGGIRSPASSNGSTSTRAQGNSQDSRPQLQLNRPIVRPRESPSRGTNNPSSGTSLREPPRTPPPNNRNRVTAAPRSAPTPSRPSSISRPSAPSGGPQSGFSTRSAPSSSNLGGRGPARGQASR
jgi:hypothetical protein